MDRVFWFTLTTIADKLMAGVSQYRTVNAVYEGISSGSLPRDIGQTPSRNMRNVLPTENPIIFISDMSVGVFSRILNRQ